MKIVSLFAALLFPLAAFLAGPAMATDELAIQLYPAFGTARGFTIEGRVAERRELSEVRADDRWWTNLWRNMRRLVNDEKAGVTVTVRATHYNWTAVTDAEGYFQISAEAQLADGGHPIKASAGDHALEASVSLLIVPDDNRLGVISDLDDTLLISEVNDKAKLLGHTLLKNPLQREPVPGSAVFLAHTLAANPRPETAAMIYLSASPRQLSIPIESFLLRNGFPRGVLITKKVTNDRTSDPLLDQVAYKTAKIEHILAQLPTVNFILLGDDGEKDSEIYQAIQKRFPERVRAVWIRYVHPDSQRTRFDGQ